MPDRKPKRDDASGPLAAKTCAACGRTMEWRKSWAKNWDSVKFCSDRCRANAKGKAADQGAELEAEILRLLALRGAGKTICPSEAARSVAAGEPFEPLMEPARAAARRLVAAGTLVITQGGHIVDGSTAKGPIRLRLR